MIHIRIVQVPKQIIHPPKWVKRLVAMGWAAIALGFSIKCLVLALRGEKFLIELLVAWESIEQLIYLPDSLGILWKLAKTLVKRGEDI